MAIDATIIFAGLLTDEESHEENLIQSFAKAHTTSLTLMKINETTPSPRFVKS